MLQSKLASARYVKRATCTDFVAKSRTNLYLLQQMLATCNNLICCKTGLNVASKTRDIAIPFVLQQSSKTSCTFVLPVLPYHQGDVTRDDSQRRFLAQYSVATLLLYCFEGWQHCSNIGKLCCAKNLRCESSRVTSPLGLSVITYLTSGEIRTRRQPA